MQMSPIAKKYEHFSKQDSNTFTIKKFVFIGISGQQTNVNKTRQEEGLIKKKKNFLYLHKSLAAMKRNNDLKK